MKRIGIIKKVVPLSEIEVEKRDGSKGTLAKLGVLVETGCQSVYVEFLQDTAREVAKRVSVNQTVLVEYDCTAREFQDKNGQPRFDNQLRGRGLQVFSDRAF